MATFLVGVEAYTNSFAPCNGLWGAFSIYF